MEDSTTNYSTIIISVLMAVVVIATVMIPIITATTQTTTTTEIDNEGAGWLKLGYNSGNDFDFEITNENSNISIGDQTGTMGDNIFYADSKNVIFADSVQNAIFLLDTESFSVHKFSNTVSVENTEGTLNISDGTETVVSSSSPTWAYVPDANGVYGFFTDGGLNLEEGKPKVAVGSYAGVFAYNDTVVAPNNLGSLGLTLSGDYADGEVIWMVSPSELDTLSVLPTDTLAPSVIDLDPISIQSVNLGGSGSVGLMATGSNTDGNWTFNYQNSTTARIISYIGPATDSLVLPNTVLYNGNPLNATILGGSIDPIVNNTLLIDGATLTFNPNTTNLSAKAFKDCSNFGGILDIPSTVSVVSANSFQNCTGFEKVIIHSGTTYIDEYAFDGCSGLDGAFVIPESIGNIAQFALRGTTNLDSLIFLNTGSLTISNSAFRDSGVKEVLNLGGSEITTTTGGMSADSVQDHVTALGYIAPVSIHNTIIVEDTSLSATLLKLLPVFMVLAVVIFIGYAMYRPDSEFVRSLKSRF